MATTMKRLFVGGLFDTVASKDLEEKFGRFGSIQDVEVKVRTDENGKPMKTFAYINIDMTDKNFKQCMGVYNKTRWKGRELQIQLAKESFVDRLRRERTNLESVNKPDEVKSIVQHASHQDILDQESRLKGAKPGMEVEGKEHWVVGKYGRILPVLNIRRKDKKKVVKVDPSKYVHAVKKLDRGQESEAPVSAPVNNLTWQLEDKDNDVTQRRKGIFPEFSPPRKKQRGKDYQVQKMTSKIDSLSVEEDTSNSDSEDVEVVSKIHQSVGISGKQYPVADKGKHQDVSHSDDTEFEVVSVVGASQSKTNMDKGCHRVVSKKTNLHSCTNKNSLVGLGKGYQSDSDMDSAGSADTDEIISSARGTQAKDHIAKSPLSPVPKTIALSSERRNTNTTKNATSKPLQSSEKVLDTRSSCNRRKDTQLKQDKKNQCKIEGAKSASGKFNGTKCHEQSGKCKDPINSLLSSEDSDFEHGYQKVLKRKLPEFGGTRKLYEDDKKEVIVKNVESQISISRKPNICKIRHYQSSDDCSDVSSDDTDEITRKFPPTNQSSALLKGFTNLKPNSEKLRPKKSNVISNLSTTNEFSTGFESHHQTLADCGEDNSSDEDVLDIVASGQISKLHQLADGSHPFAKQVTKKEELNTRSKSSACSVVVESKANGKKRKVEEKQCSDKNDKRASLSGKNEESHPNSLEKKTVSKLALKTMNLEEKQLSSNEKRLLSVRQRQKEMQKQKNLVQEALAAVDAVSSKRVVFDTDSEDEKMQEPAPCPTLSNQATINALPSSESSESGSETTESEESNGPSGVKIKSNQKVASSKNSFGSEEGGDKIGSLQTIHAGQRSDSEDSSSESSSNDSSDAGDVLDIDTAKTSQVEKSKSGMALFEESGEEESDDEDPDPFRIRSEYEGKAGRKLLEMESRYGQDIRFKLDKRFVESDSDDSEDEISQDVDQPLTEKEKSLEILKQIVGPKAWKPVSTVKNTFKDVHALHYDPTKDEHKQFEVKVEKGDKDPKKRKSKKHKDISEVNDDQSKAEAETLPEVSKERFYEVAPSLKDALGVGQNDDKPFSLLSMFGSKGHEEEAMDTEQTNEKTMKPSKIQGVFPWQQKQFSYDSSEDEDVPRSGKMQEWVSKEEEAKKDVGLSRLFAPQQTTFFFTEDDPRIAEGIAQFCRKEDMETIREKWLEKRQDLVDAYRLKRKRALRKSKGGSWQWSGPRTDASRSHGNQRGQGRGRGRGRGRGGSRS